MACGRWEPRRSYTKQEELILRRLRRTRKLFAFLRDHRDEIFDGPFQDELATMYRDTGAGKAPVPPALLAMASILQGYMGVSDAEAVELSVVDLRWQMVLDRLGCEEPAFSQGALFEFRERLIRTDMDRRLLERTIEVAQRTKAFDWKKLPKDLRVAIDSAPLEGAGRVEDTIGLLAHAARKVVECAAVLLGWSEERLAQEAGIPLLLEASVKKALDIEWSDPQQKVGVVERLARQIDALEAWLKKHLPDELSKPPLKEHLSTLEQIRAQDLEPDPSGGGKRRIREGVAPDRRISIEDPEMRHGRKSKSKRIDGYKRHIATEMDSGLILACAVTPANRPEEEAAPLLQEDIGRQKRNIRELHIDRGYVASPVVSDVLDEGGEVICKPWIARNGELFTKGDFKKDLRRMTITCPAGETQPLRPGTVVKFDPTICAICPLRPQCTTAAPGTGRTISIAENERLQQRLRKLAATPRGRERLRERVVVEHNLAHLTRRQGRRARYIGTRKNQYDVRRAATVQNLETIQRHVDDPETHGLREAA
jgi:hypothetical protein